jgi:hypothetical protein
MTLLENPDQLINSYNEPDIISTYLENYILTVTENYQHDDKSKFYEYTNYLKGEKKKPKKDKSTGYSIVNKDVGGYNESRYFKTFEEFIK